jgi:hypothetical protein
MDYDGMAPAHMYFAPQAVDDDDDEVVVHAAQLRGRGLLSVVELEPSQSSSSSSPQRHTGTTTTTTGGILQISNDGGGGGGAIRLEASFETILEWHHEHSIAAAKRQVSQVENARNWCHVARAVRVCLCVCAFCCCCCCDDDKKNKMSLTPSSLVGVFLSSSGS